MYFKRMIGDFDCGLIDCDRYIYKLAYLPVKKHVTV